MKNTIAIIIIAVTLSSCEKTVYLDLNQNNTRVIIEGQVTNKSGYQYVKVTRSVGFYATGQSPRVEDAIVSVRDDAGNEYEFAHNPGGLVDSIGYYLPIIPFKGEIGRTYELSVTVDGELYEAEDKLFRVTTIDSLAYRINDDEAKIQRLR
jgi:hypothetical protein